MACLYSLSGCSEAIEDAPTLIPTEYVPTVIALTVNANLSRASATAAAFQLTNPSPTERALTATPTPSVTITPEPSPTIEPDPTSTSLPTATEAPLLPSLTPSITPNPIIPKAQIEINVPGQLSRVIDTIALRALLFPGSAGRVFIELIGEDGRLLVRKIELMNVTLGRKVGLVTEIDFQIPGVAELGRLQIRTEDEFGRIVALNAVDLILLRDGYSDYNIAGDQVERIFIQYPERDAVIQNGNVIIRGLARPLYGQPLVAELINQNGTVVGSRLVPVDDGPLDEHRPFIVDVPYTISETTPVLLVIRERGERITGTAYLVSIPIIISP